MRKLKAPEGFLPCDGDKYKIAEFRELFAVIGHTYAPKYILEKFEARKIRE